VIAFPESNVKNDKVTVRGPKEDVDNCCKHLAQVSIKFNYKLIAFYIRLLVIRKLILFFDFILNLDA